MKIHYSVEPVFVDRSGRRRRLFTVAACAGGVALIIAALGLVAGFTGAGHGFLPGLGSAPVPGPTQWVTQRPGAAPTGPAPASAVPARPRGTASARRRAPTQAHSHAPRKK